MKFSKNLPIYIQIQEIIFENILQDKWKENEKIPSVRDFAASLEVNPNTVVKSIDKLQDLQIIENKRGIGLYVKEGAFEKIMNIKKDKFWENDFPELIHKASVYNISKEDLIQRISAIKL